MLDLLHAVEVVAKATTLSDADDETENIDDE